MACLNCDKYCVWDSGKWCSCGCHYNSRDGNEHCLRMQNHIKSQYEQIQECAELLELSKFNLEFSDIDKRRDDMLWKIKQNRDN